jgi:hypothetical protein
MVNCVLLKGEKIYSKLLLTLEENDCDIEIKTEWNLY